MKIKSLRNRFLSKGFTLIELLIVIAILGILAGGVVVAINPLGKLNSANLSKVETFDASIQNSLSINLVGEWTFNDGTANDTSGYGNNGTVTGATLTTDRKGQTNKAYSFNGTTDYIDAGNGASLNLTLYSFSAWIYPLSYGEASAARIFSKNNDWSNIMILSEDKLRARVYNGTTAFEYTTAAGVFSLNSWNHVVVVVLNDFTTKIYVNGVEKSGSWDISPTGTLNFTGTLILGNESTIVRTFDGKIDDVRIYNQALGLSQIQQLYAKGIEKHKIAVK